MKGISYSVSTLATEISYISSAFVTKQSFDMRHSRTHASEHREGETIVKYHYEVSLPTTWETFQPTNLPNYPNWLIRGYTGHEQHRSSDASLGLINMNGRMYDPVLGRMLSPDNYVQSATSTQNFNRYSYANNNPLKFTDPDGNNPLLIAALVGGFINLGIQAFTGHINSLGDAGLAFGVGALAGLTGGLAGGAVAGVVGVGGFIGGAASGAAGGFAGGFVGGSGNAWIGDANFGQGIGAGLKGGAFGAVTGGLIGGTYAGIDAARHGGDFGNGKIYEEGGQFGSHGKFLDEQIPAGEKPTATGEIAKTNTNPNYGKYGMTRNAGTRPHFGIDYAGREGDEVFGMYDGTVTKVGIGKAYGPNSVRTLSIINGEKYYIDYGHLSESAVTINQTVNGGDVIGYMGRLGNVPTYAPTHVHISIWRPVSGGLQGFVMPWWR